MTKGDLDGVQPFGRPIKPVALGSCVLMATLTIYNLVDAGVFEDLWLGDIVAILAGTSLIAMLGGWFGKSQGMAEIGLLMGFIVYVARGSFALFHEGITSEAVCLSAGAAIILGGAYLLERWDRAPHIPHIPHRMA